MGRVTVLVVVGESYCVASIDHSPSASTVKRYTPLAGIRTKPRHEFPDTYLQSAIA